MYQIYYGDEVLKDEICETEEEAFDRVNEIIKEFYDDHPTLPCEYHVKEV